MSKSHAARWASDFPTPSQLKEFFAQIECGRINKARLKSFLRGEEVTGSDWFTFTTSGLSFNELWEANSDLFFSGKDRWWKGEDFAKAKCVPRALVLRVTALPNSFCRPFEEQRELLGKAQYIPDPTDVVDGMIQLLSTDW